LYRGQTLHRPNQSVSQTARERVDDRRQPSAAAEESAVRNVDDVVGLQKNVGSLILLNRRVVDLDYFLTERSGFLPVDSDGSLDLHLLEKSIRADTAIVSVMWANNETGVLFPVEEIAAICRSKGVLYHTDAVQTPGKLKIDVKSIGADFLSLSAHKLHAPKGIGLLYIKRRTPYHPYVTGGHQERGRRGGTENVASIVGFGRAAELAMEHFREVNTRIRGLRDRLEETILKTVPHTLRNGASEPRLPNTSNIAFDLVEAEAVLMLLDQAGICASSGSACTTGSLEPSSSRK